MYSLIYISLNYGYVSIFIVLSIKIKLLYYLYFLFNSSKNYYLDLSNTDSLFLLLMITNTLTAFTSDFNIKFVTIKSL